MTKRQAIRKFRKLWLGLAKTGNLHKPVTEWVNDCPLCAYVQPDRPEVTLDRCKLCPVEWPIIGTNEDFNISSRAGSKAFQCELSLYGVWRMYYDPLPRKALAWAIAHLPEKKIK